MKRYRQTLLDLLILQEEYKVSVQSKAEQSAHLDNLRNRNAVLNKKHNLVRHKKR